MVVVVDKVVQLQEAQLSATAVESRACVDAALRVTLRGGAGLKKEQYTRSDTVPPKQKTSTCTLTK